MVKRFSTRTLIIAGAVLAVVLVPTVAIAVSQSGEIQPVTYASIRNDAVPPASADANAELARIVASLGGRAIKAHRVAERPAGYACTDDSTVAPANGCLTNDWAYLEVNVPNATWGTMRPGWEATLAGAALRDRLKAAGKSPIFNLQVTGKLPSGASVDVGGGLGDVVPSQAFEARNPQAVRSRIEDGASRANVTIISLDLLRPAQLAPAVVVTVDDPADFLANLQERTATLFGDITTYEGLYLEARDSEGPFFIAAEALRAGRHSRWFRDDVRPEGSLPDLPTPG